MLENVDEKAYIMGLSLRETYEHFIMAISQEEEDYKKARFGINQKFDIYDYFKQNYITKHKKETIKINNNLIKIKDFHSEIENRTKLMKQKLIEEIKDGMDIFNPKGM